MAQGEQITNNGFLSDDCGATLYMMPPIIRDVRV